MTISQQKVLQNFNRDRASKKYLRRTWAARLADWKRDAMAYPDRCVCWGIIAFVAIAVAHGWIR